MDPNTGKRDRITRERSRLSDVAQAGRAALEERQSSKKASAAPSPGSVADWYGRWLQTMALVNGRDSDAYAIYERQIRRLIAPGIGTIRMSELCADDVRALLGTIKAQTTRKQVRRTLAKGWKEACARDQAPDANIITRAA